MALADHDMSSSLPSYLFGSTQGVLEVAEGVGLPSYLFGSTPILMYWGVLPSLPSYLFGSTRGK